MEKNYDFCGWASRYNLECSDKRVIKKEAFVAQDGQRVPLVWNHNHTSADDVLGHAILEMRNQGVFAYGFCNDTPQGKNAKELIKHKDVTALSIFANKLKQKGNDVVHGVIREVSLVLAGANPGAHIENVCIHGDNGEEGESATIFNSSEELELNHSEDSDDKKDSEKNKDDQSEEDITKMNKDDTKKTDEKDDPTIQEVFDTLTEEQKNVVYALIGIALEEKNNENKGDPKNMKHNAFDGNEQNEEKTLSHAEVLEIIAEGKKGGSIKDAFIAHGIDGIEYLFPEARAVDAIPAVINNDNTWVQVIMNKIKKSPIAKIKTMAIDITADNARAKGYVKGAQKVEEVIVALKRTTTPTTVYKLQKLDRDDVIDIVDFDTISFLKGEMREKLNEELAQAYIIGDQRSSVDADKVNPQNIRPILGDSPVFTVPKILTPAADGTDTDFAKQFIVDVIKSRKEYKGSGNPDLFTTEDMLTNMLLIEDTTGRAIYDTIEKLKTKLRVNDIVTIPAMENAIRVDTSEEYDYSCIGILVNMKDYTSGANKGGEVNFFDDFDLNFNKLEYLMETRCSGALTKPYSAISFEKKTAHVAG